MSAPQKLGWPNCEGEVTADLLSRSVWFSEAAVALADDPSGELAGFRAAQKEFAELMDGTTPDVFERSPRLTGTARDHELCDRLSGPQLQAWKKYRNWKRALEVTRDVKLHFARLVGIGRPH